MNTSSLISTDETTTVIHKGMQERVIDFLVIAMFIFGAINIAINGVDADPNTDDNSSPLVIILSITLIILIPIGILFRTSYHSFHINRSAGTIVHAQYCFLGAYKRSTTRHNIFDIGEVVLDTKRSWAGVCGGFYGVYGTKGFPRSGESSSVNIAFQVKMFWQNPFCDSCYKGEYDQTFQSLRKALKFKHIGNGKDGGSWRCQQTTTLTYTDQHGNHSSSSSNWANVGDGMQANLSDAMNTYSNKLAINDAALVGGNYTFRMVNGFVRSVFYMTGGNIANDVNNAGTTPAPQLSTMERGESKRADGINAANSEHDEATQTNIRVVEENIKIRTSSTSSRDDARMVEFINNHFDNDYSSSVGHKTYTKSTLPATIRSSWEKNWTYRHLLITAASASSVSYSYTMKFPTGGTTACTAVAKFNKQPGVFTSTTFTTKNSWD